MSLAASHSGDSTSLSLIARAQRHEPQAWERLCCLYGPTVYRWARQVGLQDSDASDIGQEVFRTLSIRIGEFDAHCEGATFRGWLWTITRYKLGDLIRQRNSRPQPEGGTDAYQQMCEVPDAPPEESDDVLRIQADAGIASRAVELIRAEFESSTWQAFWRVVVDGQETEIVAADLGLTREAVRQAKYRVRRRLRQELEGL